MVAAEPHGRLLIRADSGPDLGLGHVMRCLALAEELSQRGFTPWFASRSLVGAEMRLRERGYSTILLAGAPHQEVDEIFRQLGVPADRATTRAPFECLVFDHYMIGAHDWLDRARALAYRRLVIDDVPNRALSCELLVNPAPGIEPHAYADLVPEGTRLLLGPAYALIRRSLREAIASAPGRTFGEVRSVVVAMGGGASHATAFALGAVVEALPRALVDVVLGAAGAGSAPPRFRGVRIHVDPDDSTLAALLARADLAVGAAGVTAYERCLAGLPSVAIEVAPNQWPAVRGFKQAGAAVAAGPLAEITHAGLVDIVRRLASDSARRASMSQRCRHLVDGRGAERIAQEVESLGMRGGLVT